jgi:hypothetical protein
MQADFVNSTTKLAFSQQVILDDGKKTTVHVAAYPKDTVRPRLLLFSKETRLLEWCKANAVDEALTGGFFLRQHQQPLGETWIEGSRQPYVAFDAPWHTMRGSLSIEAGTTRIGYRHHLPKVPSGDLLQAGPLLVKEGESLVSGDLDTEGFSAYAHQFDSDITIERHPRVAIGLSTTHILSVVCDGRSQDDAGMLLSEMAETMVNLGCEHALNLDGGGSASLITNGKLLNKPRGDGQDYPSGRPLFTAIAFDTF